MEKIILLLITFLENLQSETLQSFLHPYVYTLLQIHAPPQDLLLLQILMISLKW